MLGLYGEVLVSLHSTLPKGVLTTAQGRVVTVVHLRAVVRHEEDYAVGPHPLLCL